MILFMVKMGNKHVLCSAPDREDAKRRAFKWLGAGAYHMPIAGNPDQYTVTPLTEEGDCIHLDLTLAA